MAALVVLVIGYLYWVSRPPMEGGEYLWNVTKVIDSKTLNLKGSGASIRFRLIGARVPPAYDKQVEEFLTKSLEAHWVRIKTVRDDPKGLKEGFVFLDGEDILARLIRQGLAEIDRSEKDFDVRPYMELEQEAKKQKKGLWGQSN